jgi:hypothetical protein
MLMALGRCHCSLFSEQGVTSWDETQVSAADLAHRIWVPFDVVVVVVVVVNIVVVTAAVVAVFLLSSSLMLLFSF